MGSVVKPHGPLNKNLIAYFANDLFLTGLTSFCSILGQCVVFQVLVMGQQLDAAEILVYRIKELSGKIFSSS